MLRFILDMDLFCLYLLFCINGFIVRDRTLSGEEKVYFLPECNEGRKRILFFYGIHVKFRSCKRENINVAKKGQCWLLETLPYYIYVEKWKYVNLWIIFKLDELTNNNELFVYFCRNYSYVSLVQDAWREHKGRAWTWPVWRRWSSADCKIWCQDRQIHVCCERRILVRTRKRSGESTLPTFKASLTS